MAHWKDEEVKELLSIRGREEIKSQITGTVKDSNIYSNISKILISRGIKKSQKQVLHKLKSLRKHYRRVHEHNQQKSDAWRMEWPFYDLCNVVFGDSASANPISLPSSSAGVAFKEEAVPSPPLIIETIQSDHCDEEFSAATEDSMNSSTEEATKGDAAMPSSSSPKDTSTTGTWSMQTNVPGYNVPRRKKRPNKMEQATKTLTTMMKQLQDMDRAMQTQEDIRMQGFFEHERELQNSFLTQIMAMQERISRENRESQMVLLDRLLAHFQGSALNTSQPLKVPKEEDIYVCQL